jgi:hypothetical protein
MPSILQITLRPEQPLPAKSAMHACFAGKTLIETNAENTRRPHKLPSEEQPPGPRRIGQVIYYSY